MAGHSTADRQRANYPSNCNPPGYFVFKSENVKVKVNLALFCLPVLQDPPSYFRIITTYLKMNGMS